MSISVIVVLIVLGLLLLILEILVIPGTGVVGIIGFGMVIFGIVAAYKYLGTNTGHLILAATVVLSGASIYWSIRAKTWQKISLKSENTGKVNTIDETQIKVDDEGITISRLNPIGKARFNGEFYEVRSTGNFVDENVKVKVLRISGNQIYVIEA